MILFLLYSTYCHFQFFNHLVEEERAGSFTYSKTCLKCHSKEDKDSKVLQNAPKEHSAILLTSINWSITGL